MKMIHKVRKRRKDLMIIILFTIVLIIFEIAVKPIYAYNTELNEENHKYPVYSVLTLTLNNETKGGIQAQTRIFNQTTKEWVDNIALIEYIQNDLDKLPANITGLKEIMIFDYNTSFLPGCVYILLSPEGLDVLPAVANATINYILSDPLTWWYVENLTIELLDLAVFNIDVMMEVLNAYISRITITTFSNYSIINNTLFIDYPQRYNLTACFNYYNGTLWVPNWDFFKYFNQVMMFLNDRPIFKSMGVALTNFLYTNTSAPEPYQNALNDLNITPTFDHEVTDPSNPATDADLFHMLYDTGSFRFCISYSPLLSRTDKITLYFTLFVTIKHLWFTTSIIPEQGVPGGVPHGGETTPYSSIIFMVFSLATITILFMVRKRH